jgi:hypothetical protein
MYKYVYAKCPDCGTKVEPFADPPSDGDAIREEFEKQLPCQRNEDLPKGVIHRKGGKGGSKSSKGSGDKKQKMSKKSTKQMHDVLAAQKNKIVYRDANN